MSKAYYKAIEAELRKLSEEEASRILHSDGVQRALGELAAYESKGLFERVGYGFCLLITAIGILPLMFFYLEMHH